MQTIYENRSGCVSLFGNRVTGIEPTSATMCNMMWMHKVPLRPHCHTPTLGNEAKRSGGFRLKVQSNQSKGFLSQKNCWKPCNTMVLAFNFESESVQNLKTCVPLAALTLLNVPRILHCFVFLMPKFPAPDTFSCKWTYLNSWLYSWKTEWNWHASGSHGFNRFLSLWWHLGIYSPNKPFTEQISHTSNFSHHKLPLLSGDTFVEQQPMLTLITRRDTM